MKERPILFSGPMVRALLAGKKTQTRRVLVQPERKDGAKLVPELLQQIGVGHACPYGAVGERLWVRETWIEDTVGLHYRADEPLFPASELGGWQPSIFMPRRACRLVLEVTGVRVERLLDITVEDSFEEGIEPMRCPQCHLACYGLPGWGHDDVQITPIEAYWHLWDQINEERGYGRAKNPWVWVIEFGRVQ